MKKYILTGMAILVVSATASENPFDLKENFGQLEQDQEMLLSELRKISDLKELADEKAEKLDNDVADIELPREDLPTGEIDDIVSSSDAVPNDTPQQVEAENKQAVSPQESVISSEEKLNEMRQKALDASKEKALKEEALRQEALQKEAEKREVEAYEKKRAERLARKAAEAAVVEKEALAQKKLEEKALAEEAAKQVAKEKASVSRKLAKESEQKKQAMVTKKAKIDTEKKKTEEKSDIKVVDVKREKEEAKIAADRAYEEAVKEMSQED